MNVFQDSGVANAGHIGGSAAIVPNTSNPVSSRSTGDSLLRMLRRGVEDRFPAAGPSEVLSRVIKRPGTLARILSACADVNKILPTMCPSVPVSGCARR